MATRSQCSVEFRALRVDVPSSNFLLLLILCGSLLDAQGQGKMFSAVLNWPGCETKVIHRAIVLFLGNTETISWSTEN